MPSRKSLQAEPCPVARSVDSIGDRWSLLIIRDAFDGVRRFSDFQRSLGTARNILSDRLRKLVEVDPAAPRYIQTVWGVGYVFVPDGAN